MEGYRAKVDVQLRFRDTDALGHVNNAVFLTWMELGRMALTEAVLPKIDWTKLGFILAHISIDYIEPVFLKDRVTVHMKVGRVGEKSVTFECLITKADEKGERPAAKGTNIIVAFDYEQNASVAIPGEWKTAMQQQ